MRIELPARRAVETRHVARVHHAGAIDAEAGRIEPARPIAHKQHGVSAVRVIEVQLRIEGVRANGLHHQPVALRRPVALAEVAAGRGRGQQLQPRAVAVDAVQLVVVCINQLGPVRRPAVAHARIAVALRRQRRNLALVRTVAVHGIELVLAGGIGGIGHNVAQRAQLRGRFYGRRRGEPHQAAARVIRRVNVGVAGRGAGKQVAVVGQRLRLEAPHGAAGAGAAGVAGRHLPVIRGVVEQARSRHHRVFRVREQCALVQVIAFEQNNIIAQRVGPGGPVGVPAQGHVGGLARCPRNRAGAHRRIGRRTAAGLFELQHHILGLAGRHVHVGGLANVARASNGERNQAGRHLREQNVALRVGHVRAGGRVGADAGIGQRLVGAGVEHRQVHAAISNRLNRGVFTAAQGTHY